MFGRVSRFGGRTMRWKLIGIGAGVLAIAVAAALVVVRARTAVARPALSTPKEKLSYAAGVFVARSLKDQKLELDIDVAEKGLKEAFSSQQLLMSEDSLRETMNAYQKDQKQKQAEAAKRVAEANRKTSDAFLTENAKAEGVVSLPSGL